MYVYGKKTHFQHKAHNIRQIPSHVCTLEHDHYINTSTSTGSYKLATTPASQHNHVVDPWLLKGDKLRGEGRIKKGTAFRRTFLHFSSSRESRGRVFWSHASSQISCENSLSVCNPRSISLRTEVETSSTRGRDLI